MVNIKDRQSVINYSIKDLDYKEGEIVKLRNDMGGFKLKIIKIHNEVYCTCEGYNKKDRHINMIYLEKIIK